MNMIVRMVVMGLVAILLVSCDNASNSSKNSKDDSDSSKKASETLSASNHEEVADTAPTAALQPKPKHSPETTSPAKLSPDQAALVESGKELFEDNCEACHQADAIGKPGTAPSLTNPELLSIASDKFFISTITDGREGTPMPAFGEDLKPDEIKAIVAFLRSHEKLPNRSAQVDSEAESHGDPRLGKFWFGDICSTCHGVNGSGYEAGGTGTAIGKSGFLSKVSDGFIRETVKHGRSNTRMRGFTKSYGLANLSDRDIDDIVAYLRVLGKKNAKAAADEDE